MKKIIFSLVAVVMGMAVANAQTTVLGSRTFDNVYVTLEGGAIAPIQSVNGFFNDIRPTVGIEVGKNFTPVVGFSVEALGGINTTGAATWFDQSNFNGNVKVNLCNWFGGYKGEPRVVDVSLVSGMGWGRDYVAGGTPYNYLTYNDGAQIDFNLGKAKAWQINVKPLVTFAARNGSYGFHKEYGAAQVMAGVTYKFKNSHGTHNFVTCPYTVTKADYDAVVAELEALKAKKPEQVEVVKEVPVEKVVKEEVTSYANVSSFVTFKMGSSTLTAVEYAKVKAFASQLPKGTPVVVTGSADLGTGSEARNHELATKRAEVVASALKDCGVENVAVQTAYDTNENAEASRAAVLSVN